MKRLRIFLIALFFLALVILGVFFLVGYLNPKSAGILVEAEPSASVFFDGVSVGRTPYEETRKPGEVIVKLVPESFETPLAPFETKVTLVSGVKTVVRRSFGDSLDTSSGEIVSFEKVGGNQTGVSVVSIPDVTQISIDGQIRGFAPYKTSTVSPGEHELTISLPGFIERKLNIRTYSGYKLTAVVKLAPSGEAVEPPPEEVPTQEKEEVEILATPTGFLRVRSEPSTLGEEVGQVTPGERYRLVEEDERTGWFKIEYEEAKEGWVSNQYAKKVEEETSETPSPSPKASPAT